MFYFYLWNYYNGIWVKILLVNIICVLLKFIFVTISISFLGKQVDVCDLEDALKDMEIEVPYEDYLHLVKTLPLDGKNLKCMYPSKGFRVLLRLWAFLLKWYKIVTRVFFKSKYGKKADKSEIFSYFSLTQIYLYSV